ncbi:hypothetical protein [Bacillus sp. FJAT-27245]|uniref:hypothetical protein n=1 Tax=Bacillus sp. FJAT-27245 TaxID=1684144 RepID=UPI000A8B0612|nr:hypothetical protein [Bacillus sp. FJAT-27245]
MLNKRKLMLSIGTGILGISFLVGGATYSLFTSNTTNEDNNFSTGTLILKQKRDHGDYNPGPMFYTNQLDPKGRHPYDKKDINPSGEAIGGWAPGDKVKRTMIVWNEGTLDARITGLKANPRSTFTHKVPGTPVTTRTINGEISGDSFNEFIEKANVMVAIPDLDIELYNGPLKNLIFEDEDEYASLLNEPVLTGTSGEFQPGPLNITFEVSLDKSAGNIIQNKNFIFDLGFFSEQDKNNP